MVAAIGFLFAAVLFGLLIALVGLIIVSWDEARTRLEERRALQEAVERQKRLIQRRKNSNWNHQVGTPVAYINGKEEGIEHYESN